jgi:hypothetical protein
VELYIRWGRQPGEANKSGQLDHFIPWRRAVHCGRRGWGFASRGSAFVSFDAHDVVRCLYYNNCFDKSDKRERHGSNKSIVKKNQTTSDKNKKNFLTINTEKHYKIQSILYIWFGLTFVIIALKILLDYFL